MKKSIVFDFGQVLIQWSPYFLYRKLLPSDEAIREFLEEIKFNEFNPRMDAGYSFEQTRAEVLSRHPGKRDLADAFFSRWTECSGEPNQDVVALMLELKHAGHPVYGLSNWSAETFAWVKPRYAFLEELNDYLISGAVGEVKPGEKIYQLFLERVGKRAQECVFIDDSPANIEAARRLGFTGILFTSPEQLRLDLQTMGILQA